VLAASAIGALLATGSLWIRNAVGG